MAEVDVWKVITQADPYTLEKIRIPPSSSSLDTVSQKLPGGSYTTFRTYGGTRVIRLSDHLARLNTAALLLEQNNISMNTAAVRSALREVVALFPSSEHRIRLTMDLEQEPGNVYIALEKMSPLPLHVYQQGVKTITCSIQRSVPKAKLTRFINSAYDIRQQMPEDVHEALMISSGKILEGLSSNFFAVKEGVVWTAEEGVLSGVTRSVVLDEIRSEGILCRFSPLRVEDISVIEEAFITSSSRGVLSVVQIDDQQIGVGRPGPVTIQLHKRYLQRIEDELEEI
jgi:branched-chain amino acid aminotransferase